MPNNIFSKFEFFGLDCFFSVGFEKIGEREIVIVDPFGIVSKKEIPIMNPYAGLEQTPHYPTGKLISLRLSSKIKLLGTERIIRERMSNPILWHKSSKEEPVLVSFGGKSNRGRGVKNPSLGEIISYNLGLS